MIHMLHKCCSIHLKTKNLHIPPMGEYAYIFFTCYTLTFHVPARFWKVVMPLNAPIYISPHVSVFRSFNLFYAIFSIHGKNRQFISKRSAACDLWMDHNNNSDHSLRFRFTTLIVRNTQSCNGTWWQRQKSCFLLKTHLNSSVLVVFWSYLKRQN